MSAESSVSPEQLLPLTDPMFHILLSLVDAERHGYGILLEIERRTEGDLRMGTGTLYSALRRLRDKQLIQEAPEAAADDDERRIYYRLTELGDAVVRAEAARLDRLVSQARGKHVLPGESR